MSKKQVQDERENGVERSSKNPLLDTKGKFVRQTEDESLNFRLNIWKMRKLSSGILTLPEEAKIKRIAKAKALGVKPEDNYPAICLCGRYHRGKKQSNVLLAKGSDTGKVFYSNLVACGSVWRCPVCSWKITKVRQMEVFKLLSWYQRNDYTLSFLTLTLRHKRVDPLKNLLERLLSEFRKFQRVRKYREFAVTYLGMVKATEITWSAKNGWHPHLHIVFVHKKSVNFREVELLMNDLLPDWCNRKGVNGRIGGQNFQRVSSDKELSDYITKWDSSKEITQGSFKLHHDEKIGKSRVKYDTAGASTAFGMLYKVVTKKIERKEIKSLFETYVRATRGKNQLIISSGLRSKYKELNPETKEDLEIVKDERIQALLLSISHDLWLDILKKDAAPSLLFAYEKNGIEGFKSKLDELGISFDSEYLDDLKIPILY